MVKSVATQAEFNEILAANPKVVVDFTATWCGPCRMIGPIFEKMAESGDYPNVTFIKVDVDANADTAQACGISAMPTFQSFINGTKTDDLCGASEQKLKELVEKLNAA